MINYQVIIVIALQLSCDPQQQQTATSHLTLRQNYKICLSSLTLPILVLFDGITERGTSIFFKVLFEVLNKPYGFCIF